MYRKAPWFLRMVAFNPPTTGKWVITLVLTLLFSVLGLIAYGNMEELATIAREGSTVTGTVIDRDRVVTVREDSEGDRREEVTYYIEYTYDPGRGDPPDIRTGRQEVSQQFYNTHGTESELTVYYMPDDRGSSYIDLNGLLGDEMFMLIGFAVIAGIMWYVVLANIIVARWYWSR